MTYQRILTRSIKMNYQRIFTRSIKMNTKQFVAIKHVISNCHHSVEEIHYLVSYTTIKIYKKTPNNITLFYPRTVQMTDALIKIYFILRGNSKALARKVLHN